VQTHFIDDDPADGIIAMIDTAKADTIVIGPHGNGHGPTFGLGSVTRRLLHASPVPVVIVDGANDSVAENDGDAGETTAPANATFVLACVGYGSASANAADWAALYASERGLPLVILHVVSYRPIFPFAPPTDMLAYYLGGDVSEAWAHDDLDDIREHIGAAHPDLQITTEVGHGSAAKGIAKISAGAELVVIGRLQNAGLASCVISTRTKAIITGVSAPVAVIPSTK
jgi:nucleotide-binding universal stress UspA family protein